MGLAVLGALGAAALTVVARRQNSLSQAFMPFLAGAVLLQLLAAASLVWLMGMVGDARLHARSAIVFVTLGYCALHCGIAALMAGHTIWRMVQGYVSARRATDLTLAFLWNSYAVVATVPAVLLVILLDNAA